MRTTVRMITTSAKLSPSTTASTPLMAAAMRSMIIMGSAICSKKRRMSGFPGGALSRFLPFSSRRRCASCALSPSALLCTSRSTVSFFSR